MKTIVAIIGSQNSGKSTVITSLTGCPGRGYRAAVTDRSTGQSVFVIASSPQEKKLTFRRFRAILKQVRSNASFRGIVLSLQPSNPYKNKPMLPYLQIIRANRAYRFFAFVLDPPYNVSRNSAQYSFPYVKSLLTPLRIKPIRLDGRKFSLINSQRIQRLTRIMS